MAGSFISGGTDGRRVGKHNLRRNNSGFTLVELIVVIVLIAVMAALTVGGILSWRDWADFNRENEYAETLFVAAQNQLNDYSADGRLEAMQKTFAPKFTGTGGEDSDSDPVRKLREKDGYKAVFGVGKNWTYDGMGESGSAFVDAGYTGKEINDIWAGSNSDTKYQDRIVSLRAEKGDYSRYLNGEFTKEQEQYWVYELLSSYIYDPSILNDAAICIELTPADGQVFSVFYSDKNEQYTYAGSIEEPEADSSRIYDVTKNNREEEIRRGRKVGYYNVAALYKSTSIKTKGNAPKISDVRLFNKETLYMTFMVKDMSAAYKDIDYTIRLLDADVSNNPAELEITINNSGKDGEHGIYNKESANKSGGTVKGTVTRYDLVDGKRTGSKDLGTMPILVWYEPTDSFTFSEGRKKDLQIHVVLDQIDFKASAYDYNQYYAQDRNNGFKETQSFFRFGLMPDDVFAEVEANENGKKISADDNKSLLSGMNKENTSYGSGLYSDGKITYSVKNSRHLYNIRYLEALDYDKQSAPDKDVEREVSSVIYKIDEDIDWAVASADEDDYPKRDITKDFPSIERLRKNDEIKGKDNDSTISNLTISYDSNNIYESYLVADISGNPTLRKVEPTGFVNFSYGKIRDLTLDKLKVIGNDYTGGFFGFTTCKADNLTLTDSCIIEGRKYVGGIAGLAIPYSDVEETSPSGDDETPVEEWDGTTTKKRVEQDGIAYEFELTGGPWDNGEYRVQITIYNQTGKKIDNWTLKMDFPGELEDDNQSVIDKHEGTVYTIKNAQWNSDIQPNSSVSFGMKGKGGFKGLPRSFGLAGVPVKVEIKDYEHKFEYKYNGNEYDNQFQGEISITNTSDKTIEDWEISFTFDRYITSIWNAEILSNEGNKYYIKNSSNTSGDFIAPGETKSFGFMGYGGAKDSEPSDYILTSYESDDSRYNTGTDSGNSGNPVNKDNLSEENFIEMKKLTNRAVITGSQAVGGIVGGVRNDYTFIKKLYTGSGTEGNLTDNELINEFRGLDNRDSDKNIITRGNDRVGLRIKDCMSYGSVKTGIGDSINEDEISYVGGIAGYVYDHFCDSPGKDVVRISIEDCNGAPMYTPDYLVSIFTTGTGFNNNARGDYVGGIAGFNYGGEVRNCFSLAENGGSSYVYGRNYVGGLTGINLGYLVGDENATEYGRCINTNKVAGLNYVGGISGTNADYVYVYTDNTAEEGSSKTKTRTIESFDPEAIIAERESDNTLNIIPKKDINLCNKIAGFENKAQVYAGTSYGGGITGYNTGYLYGNNNTFSYLDNSPLFADTNDNYYGSYLGGISGYNNGIISNSERSVSEDGKTSSLSDNQAVGEEKKVGCYIRGKNYLGGITGYNDSDSIIEGYKVGDGQIRGVDGSCFVGGFAGFNSAAGLLMDPVSNNGDSASVSYNGSHTIYSNIDVIKGDYFVGGDIGGNIINKQENKEISIITGSFSSDGFFRSIEGKEFVGGYIGYNLILNNDPSDLSAIDNNYEGKYASEIVAEYLVGAIGLGSGDLKGNKEKLDNIGTEVPGLKAADNTSKESYLRLYIKGEYDEQNRKVSRTSTLNSIKGDICVGGVMGYSDDNTMLYIENVENATPVVANQVITYPKERHISRSINSIDTSKPAFVIEEEGNKDYTNEASAEEFLYSYCGGIIGKVGEKTTLNNCRNSQQGLIDTKGTYIGGLCEVNAGTLINCSVSNMGNGSHDYVGGLCGLNKGIIKECNINNITISGKNVVGGLTAENFGTLSNNKINKSHIRAMGSGDGVAGTYAGVNGKTGVIEVSIKTGTDYDIDDLDVVSTGRYVGGIAGVNKGFIRNSKTSLKKDNSDEDINNYIKFSGTIRGASVVGGLVGLNEIDITDKSGDEAPEYALEGFDNYADVIADNGTAGGIVGRSTGKSVISYCANHGSVSAPLSGNSGGIIAENNGLISYCRDYESVSAVNGMSGGIVAINQAEGEILNIRVEKDSNRGEKPSVGNLLGVSTPSDDKNNDDTIVFESKDSVGAVAAINKGKISGIYINNVNIQNESGHGSAYVGAVTGQNVFPVDELKVTYENASDEQKQRYGYISLAGTDESGESIDKILNCTIRVKSNYTNAGGIAGSNSGTITGTDKNRRALVSPRIKLEGCDRASIGGVVGTNSEEIRYISVDAEIIGGKGNSTNSIGYGGVAGINAGTINYCTFDGVINTFGDAANPTSTGGIAGINRNRGIVEFCGVGVSNRNDEFEKSNEGNTTWIASGDFYKRDFSWHPDLNAYAYLGGFVGRNQGIVREIDMDGLYDDTASNHLNTTDYVGIIGFNGAVGGIVGVHDGGSVGGYVRSDGTERYMTTCGAGKTEVAMHGSETGSGAGGVIGVDHTGGTIKYIKSKTFVQARYHGDVYGGGVVAACIPSNGGRVTFDHVYYYGNESNKKDGFGDVTAYSSAGGIVGTVRYAGFNFVDCENYGEIRSEYDDAGGIIGSSYMLNASSYFTSCNNHGWVHLPRNTWDGKDRHGSSAAGGMLGSYNETNGNEHIYLYDCVNTGIIQKDWNNNDNPDIDTIAQNVGSFVGGGFAMLEGYDCHWHFDMCRNYNPIKDTTEGFIGTSYRMATETFTNCFDNSALVTSNKKYSPFLTHRGDEVNMSNCYYLNNEQTSFITNESIQFTVLRGKNDSGNGIDSYYKGIQYKKLKSPGAYLTPPGPDSDITIEGNTGSFVFTLSNLRNNNSGMSAFNVYMWNNKNSNLDTKYNYSVYASFIDENGKSANSATETVSATSDVESSKVSLKVPAGLDNKKIARIIVHAKLDSITRGQGDTSTLYEKIYLRGFTWTTADNNQESTCKYLGDQYGMEFSIDSLDTDHSNKSISIKNGPQYTSEEYSEDVLGTLFRTGEGCYLRSESTSYGPILTIGVDHLDNSFGIGSFVLHMTGEPGNSKKTFQYRLKVTFIDEDGKRYKHYPAASISDNYTTLTIDPGETEDLSIANLNYKAKSLSKIEIEFADVKYSENGRPFSKTNRYYFKGFGIIPYNTGIECPMAPKSNYGITATTTESSESIKLLVDSSNSPDSYKVYQNMVPDHYFTMLSNDPSSENYYSDKSTYYISKEKGRNYRISTYEEMDPKYLEFIKENYSFTPDENNLRLMKPTVYFEGEGSELKFSWDEIEGAFGYEVRYRIIDENNNNIDPAASDEYYNARLGTQGREYAVFNNPDWSGKGYRIEFQVKAVNGGSSAYDSEYSMLTHRISKRVLPIPKVHLELTDDNNMAVVLDNRDDYRTELEDGTEGYIDCDIEVTYNGRGIDIERERREVFVVHVKDSMFSTQSRWVELDDEDSSMAQIVAKAVPAPDSESTALYVDSAEIVSSGHLADCEELIAGDSKNTDEEYQKYKGQTYIPYNYHKRLRGFKGDDVEHMEYIVQYDNVRDKDAWMRTDISEYDEDLEMWVAVATNEAHIGSNLRSSEYITSLGNLPKEWFSEDNPKEILVRNYLDRSENDIVKYGRTIASNIKLDGGSAEANKEILKQYKDPYYLTIDWDATDEAVEAGEIEEIDGDVESYCIKVIENASIWDDEANSLRAGYVLVREDTDEDIPTYSIYYNSTLRLSETYANVIKRGKNYDEDDYRYVYVSKKYLSERDRYKNYYDYFLFDVVYKVYDTSVKETMIEYEGSEEKETVSTNGIRAYYEDEDHPGRNDHRKIVLENGHIVGTNYNESYQFSRTNDKYSDRIYQDTSPAPILSGGIKVTRNAEGKAVYTVNWDEHYRNEYMWNDGLDPSDEEDASVINEYMYYQPTSNTEWRSARVAAKEDYYVANTWTAFANKTNFYRTDQNLTNGQRKEIMNAYYLTYTHNTYAENGGSFYTVELLGKVGDDDYVVLETQKIDDTGRVEVNDSYTDETYEYTAKDGTKKTAQKYRKWVYRTSFVKEDDWVYDEYLIRITNNGDKYCMLEGITDTKIKYLYYDTPFDDIDSVDGVENMCYYRLPKYKEFNLKPMTPFTRLDMPTYVKIKTTGESAYEKGLDYTIKWNGIPGNEAEQYKDLGGYLITARVVEPAVEGETAKNHYYIIEEIGDESIANASIDIDRSSLSENGIVMDLDPVSANYVKDGDARCVDVDFSDFNDGDRVEIFVNAISRTKAERYCDSEDGVPFEIVVASALTAPDADKVIVEEEASYDDEDVIVFTDYGIPEYDALKTRPSNMVSANAVSENSITDKLIDDGTTLYGAVDYDIWKNGLWISYAVGDDASDRTNYLFDNTVSVNAAIAIYDTAPDEKELPPKEEMSEEEAKEWNEGRKHTVPDSTALWNDGAVVTLYGKDDPLSLGYVSDRNKIQIPLSSDDDEFGTQYAGMWVKIALKAVSESGKEPESRWSDQDAAGVSVNYRWIHLPYILKDTGNSETEEPGKITNDGLDMTTDTGGLLIENGNSENERNSSDVNSEELLVEDRTDTLSPDDGVSLKTESGIESMRTPSATPTPMPEDADVPSAPTKTTTETENDKDKNSGGGSADPNKENETEDGNDAGTPRNNTETSKEGTEPEGSN